MTASLTSLLPIQMLPRTGRGTPLILFIQSQEKEKKKKYLQPCLEQRWTFEPFDRQMQLNENYIILLQS